jgi:hypothetical protein
MKRIIIITAFLFVSSIKLYSQLYSENSFIVTCVKTTVSKNIRSSEIPKPHEYFTARNRNNRTANQSNYLENNSPKLLPEQSFLPPDCSAEDSFVFDIRKNAVYIKNLVIFPSVCYDRTFVLDERMAVVLTGGLSAYDHLFFIGEASLLLGRTKHFFETGAGYDFGAQQTNFYGRLCYRYTGEKGLLIKAGLQIVKNVPVFPVAALGFSF